MAAIVICEFMDEDAIKSVLAGYDVLYDAALVERRSRLAGGACRCARADRAQPHAGERRTAGEGAEAAAVGRLGVGLDNIDVAACKARGVAVYPATGANDVSVVEYVIATMLTLLRGAYGATGAVIEGKWPRTALIGGREANGKILGIVGFGAIGRKVGGAASCARHARRGIRPEHACRPTGCGAR